MNGKRRMGCGIVGNRVSNIAYVDKLVRIKGIFLPSFFIYS
jgi:hypothetical protein